MGLLGCCGVGGGQAGGPWRRRWGCARVRRGRGRRARLALVWSGDLSPVFDGLEGAESGGVGRSAAAEALETAGEPASASEGCLEGDLRSGVHEGWEGSVELSRSGEFEVHGHGRLLDASMGLRVEDPNVELMHNSGDGCVLVHDDIPGGGCNLGSVGSQGPVHSGVSYED